MAKRLRTQAAETVSYDHDGERNTWGERTVHGLAVRLQDALIFANEVVELLRGVSDHADLIFFVDKVAATNF